MIANVIAEMRTYGEGFIIADQAPGLLDVSVIRNTNTKIIMRLPDLSDRELVGKAANLNDHQINELAKLPCGVAAVYQNEWVQPVLCKVARFENSSGRFSYKQDISINKDNVESRIGIARLLSSCTRLDKEHFIKDIFPMLREIKIDSSVIVRAAKLMQDPPQAPEMTKLSPIMSALFPKVYQNVKTAYSRSNRPENWTRAAEAALSGYEIDAQVRRDIIQAIITDYVYLALGRANELEQWSREGGLS